MEGFIAGVAEAEEADGGDEQEAESDEEFAAVGPIDGSVFQGGISEEAVPEQCGGGEIDREVEGLPEMAAETDAHIGSDDDEGEEVKSDGADRVVEWLGGGMDGVEEIEDAEARVLVEEQNHRMKDGSCQRNVAGPVVNAEIVEAVMRPRAEGTVAESHEQAQKHIQGDGADSGEADVRGEIQDGQAHGQHRSGIVSFAQVPHYDV